MLRSALQAIRSYSRPGEGEQKREAGGIEGSIATGPSEESSVNLMSHRADGRIQSREHPHLGVAVMFFPHLTCVTTFKVE